MARRRYSITVGNPMNDGATKLRVRFFVRPSDEWAGGYTEDDEYDIPVEEDPDAELVYTTVEECIGGEWVNVTDEWRDSNDLPELEELVRDRYIERVQERYADRLIA